MGLTKDKNVIRKAELAEMSLNRKFPDIREVSHFKGSYLLSTHESGDRITNWEYRDRKATDYFKKTDHNSVIGEYSTHTLEIYKETNGKKTPLIEKMSDLDMSNIPYVRNTYAWVNEDLEEILLKDGIEMVNS
jgi:hypothetical protein